MFLPCPISSSSMAMVFLPVALHRGADNEVRTTLILCVFPVGYVTQKWTSFEMSKVFRTARFQTHDEHRD